MNKNKLELTSKAKAILQRFQASTNQYPTTTINKPDFSLSQESDQNQQINRLTLFQLQNQIYHLKTQVLQLKSQLKVESNKCFKLEYINTNLRNMLLASQKSIKNQNNLHQNQQINPQRYKTLPNKIQNHNQLLTPKQVVDNLPISGFINKNQLMSNFINYQQQNPNINQDIKKIKQQNDQLNTKLSQKQDQINLLINQKKQLEIKIEQIRKQIQNKQFYKFQFEKNKRNQTNQKQIIEKQNKVNQLLLQIDKFKSIINTQQQNIKLKDHCLSQQKHMNQHLQSLLIQNQNQLKELQQVFFQQQRQLSNYTLKNQSYNNFQLNMKLCNTQIHQKYNQQLQQKNRIIQMLSNKLQLLSYSSQSQVFKRQFQMLKLQMKINEKENYQLRKEIDELNLQIISKKQLYKQEINYLQKQVIRLKQLITRNSQTKNMQNNFDIKSDLKSNACYFTIQNSNNNSPKSQKQINHYFLSSQTRNKKDNLNDFSQTRNVSKNNNKQEVIKSKQQDSDEDSFSKQDLRNLKILLRKTQPSQNTIQQLSQALFHSKNQKKKPQFNINQFMQVKNKIDNTKQYKKEITQSNPRIQSQIQQEKYKFKSSQFNEQSNLQKMINLHGVSTYSLTLQQYQSQSPSIRKANPQIQNNMFQKNKNKCQNHNTKKQSGDAVTRLTKLLGSQDSKEYKNSTKKAQYKKMLSTTYDENIVRKQQKNQSKQLSKKNIKVKKEQMNLTIGNLEQQVKKIRQKNNQLIDNPYFLINYDSERISKKQSIKHYSPFQIQQKITNNMDNIFKLPQP